MLTPLDDTLWHQLPTTFDHVWTSDPRWFDRYWFAIYSQRRPRGDPGHDGCLSQHERARWRRGHDRRRQAVQPAGLALARPQRRDRLRSAARPAGGAAEVLRDRHRARRARAARRDPLATASSRRARSIRTTRGCRAAPCEDYRRFDQIGVASGWLEVEGQRIEIDRWWSCRDHSWGVRRGMGVPEPVTGPKVTLAEKGHVMSFLFFSTDTMSGSLLFSGRGDDEPYTTGVVTDRRTQEAHHATEDRTRGRPARRHAALPHCRRQRDAGGRPAAASGGRGARLGDRDAGPGLQRRLQRPPGSGRLARREPSGVRRLGRLAPLEDRLPGRYAERALAPHPAGGTRGRSGRRKPARAPAA